MMKFLPIIVIVVALAIGAFLFFGSKGGNAPAPTAGQPAAGTAPGAAVPAAGCPAVGAGALPPLEPKNRNAPIAKAITITMIGRNFIIGLDGGALRGFLSAMARCSPE